jgi:hypothetical protein
MQIPVLGFAQALPTAAKIFGTVVEIVEHAINNNIVLHNERVIHSINDGWLIKENHFFSLEHVKYYLK